MMPLRLGTRKSALAKTQAYWVANRLQALFPEVAVELFLIETTGDVLSAVPSEPPPPETGGLKALFTKEIEQALIDDQIDLAVHSLKDMASDLPPDLVLAAVPQREDPRDVWIGKNGMKFRSLPRGAAVATGAVRRQAQLLHLRPDLKCVPMRGNVDTRLKKLEAGDFAGMVLALAGLKRLNREAEATEVLSTDIMLPAVGQGALAIESRINNPKVYKFVKAINDTVSYQAITAERAFQKTLGGNCQTPIAAYAQVLGERLNLTGEVLSPSGQPCIRVVEEGHIAEAKQIGERVAQAILARGGDKLLS